MYAPLFFIALVVALVAALGCAPAANVRPQRQVMHRPQRAPSRDGEWVVAEAGNPHASGWSESGAPTYVVRWSTGFPVFSYQLGDRERAEQQAAKMNELGLGQFWRQGMSVEKGNEIHEILTRLGMTSPNYMD